MTKTFNKNTIKGLVNQSLILHYEKNLEKVKFFHSGGSLNLEIEKGNDYIAFAEKELEAVKNGRTW